ncbi:MAG: hypothetical protein IPQ03_02370 [Bacteroidetes bacterium]|nr:hypothetical protein [Bacteroidota bacterium]MBK9543490.1 hypothetical protein [Bacteroidota bacterium]MBL0256415.1 hypothetical protein [Bacteroidota bacterium]MBP6401713.1 hypothetical protein [Bacteroidia bacterium]MBP6648951.1 hypothetical protein [Bacteroidia bacterium]
MKRILILIFSFFSVFATSYGQAKKPTLMILPSDVWCNTNGYMMEFDNQGTVEKIPDYKKAFQENADLINVISKINGLMADRGFPLKNAETILKNLSGESAEEAMISGKTKGGGVAESPVDKLKKTAKADIIIQLTWILNTTGPKKSVTFNLQGLDSYSAKQVATAQGTGAPSFAAEVPVLLEEAVLSHMDNFTASLQKHFDDMFENGREIVIRVKKFDSWSDDFDKDFGGKELKDIIEAWVHDNTVKNRFSATDMTENMLFFEQVRMPLYDATNKALDARNFVKGLQKMIEAPPYSIPCKLMMKGLGQATLYVGDK